MALSDQELIRRENLEKIKVLGFNPFPAETFESSFRTNEMTTSVFKDHLIEECQKQAIFGF